MTIQKQRDSNIELLRIVAMFSVLLIHIDFLALGFPTVNDIRTNTFDAILRVFFQSLTVSCVDIFVFISGWFGIKPRLKGLCSYLFQCFFFLFGLYMVTLALGYSSLSVSGFLGCIAATNVNWFIKAYLLLYILSPILNAFVSNTSRKDFRSVLILFYLFQFLYGWIFKSATAFIQDGYSTISFIGLYLLARYLYIYKPNICAWRTRRLLSMAFFLIFIITILYVVPPLSGYMNTIALGNTFLSYISPTTIFITACVVISFSKLRIQSSIVNLLAKSSFAVFLFHTNPNLSSYYLSFFNELHDVVTPLGYWIVSFPV